MKIFKYLLVSFLFILSPAIYADEVNWSTSSNALPSNVDINDLNHDIIELLQQKSPEILQTLQQGSPDKKIISDSLNQAEITVTEINKKDDSNYYLTVVVRIHYDYTTTAMNTMGPILAMNTYTGSDTPIYLASIGSDILHAVGAISCTISTFINSDGVADLAVVGLAILAA